MPLDYDEINDLGQQYYGDRTKPVPKPEVEFGIDTSNQIIYDINTVKSERIDTATINSFTQVSQRRDELYNLIDSMCEDTRLSAALEIYVEDVTEKAPSGKIIWAESNNSDIQAYVNFLLDSLNIDKYISVNFLIIPLIPLASLEVKLFFDTCMVRVEPPPASLEPTN